MLSVSKHKISIYNKAVFALLIIVIAFPFYVDAQEIEPDTMLLLKEVKVDAPRFTHHQVGLNTTTFDSLQKQAYYHKNISELLSDESPLFIKSYGLGSLATTSFRGGSANHTAVFWNGISLSSPMNGLLDLSLAPVFAADELYIQHGAGSALFGSGAIAGVIHLANKPKFNQGIRIKGDFSIGSFSDFRQNVLVEISQKRWVSSIQLFNSFSQNDFPFTNNFSATETKKRQTNANLTNRGIINENKWLIGKYSTFSLNTWWQSTNRNIPPTMLQQQSLASQQDNALRMHAEWNYQIGKFATFVRTAWLNEKLLYTDDIAEINSISKTQQLISEVETKITLHPLHEINVGLHHTFAQASNKSFEQIPKQNRMALFAAYQVQTKNKKLQARISFRNEIVDSELVPFTFSIGSDYQILKWLTAKASVSKVYRIPTMNDLYWTPGGNLNLLPESGYAQEGGLSINFRYKNLSFISNLTLFNRNIDNWIVWLPNFSFWTPQNLMQVWSRGMETHNTLTFSKNKFRVALTLLTNYVLSENQQAKTINDASVGRQLIYTPMYSGMLKMAITCQSFLISYRHNYTGFRYTSTDNTQYLMPFDLGALQVSYRVQFNNFSGSVFFEINNMWNEQYQVLSNRPMPGINYQTGISFQFNKPNKKFNNN